MTELLFDTPWWLPAAGLAIGAGVFVHGNRRTDTTVRNMGLLLILLAVAWAAVSYLMQTPREVAEHRTRAIVDSVEARDFAKLTSLLEPTTELSVLSGSTAIYADRNAIVGGARAAVEIYGLRNARVLSSSSRQDDTFISVTLDCLSEQDFTGGRPLPTGWQFEYQRTADGWTLARIVCIRIGGLANDQMPRQFPRPK